MATTTPKATSLSALSPSVEEDKSKLPFNVAASRSEHRNNRTFEFKKNAAKEGPKEEVNRKGSDRNRKPPEKDEMANSGRQNGFKNERGLPNWIPDGLREKKEFTIECAVGEPKSEEFKMTKGLLFLQVPPAMFPPLDFGDHIQKLNREPVRSRHHFNNMLKEIARSHTPHTIQVEIERVVAAIPLTKADPEFPREAEDTCEYFKGVLVMFPQGALGLNIKSVNRKVYIENTDNGFQSLGRRCLFIGDCILSIDGKSIFSVKEAKELLVNGLQNRGYITMIVERAVVGVAVAYVRAVLLSGKKPEIDSTMQEDILNICKEEIKNMKNIVEPKPILRNAEAKKITERIAIAENSKEMGIGMEMINPKNLQKVPKKDKKGKDKKGAA